MGRVGMKSIRIIYEDGVIYYKYEDDRMRSFDDADKFDRQLVRDLIQEMYVKCGEEIEVEEVEPKEVTVVQYFPVKQ